MHRYFTEQINYLTLFSKWREADETNKKQSVLQEVLRYFQLNIANIPDASHELETYVSGICKYFKRLWERHNRTLSKVLKHNSEYFEREFRLPSEIVSKLPQTFHGKGRKTKPFNESSECVKRRKTASLRSNYEMVELAYAAQMSLRSSGYSAAAAVVKETTQTGTVSNMSTTKNAPKFLGVVPYTDFEALAFIIDEDLSKSQYCNMRKNAKLRNVDLYPSYHKILAAKQSCYPDGIKVSETVIDIPLQALLDHTCLRILQSIVENLNKFSDDELKQVTMVFKWGFDGSSGHSEYKQIFTSNGEAADSHMFLTSVVPIKADVEGRILFQNPTPASTRFCRPLRIQ